MILFFFVISDSARKNGHVGHPLSIFDGSSGLNHIIISGGEISKRDRKNPLTMFELDVIQNKWVRICFRLKIRRIDPSNYSGVSRNIGPDLLGACSLFLHIWCNCCLWESTCHTQVRVFVHFLYSIQNVIAKILSRSVWN